MGKSTISMAIFNSYVSLPEGTYNCWFSSGPLKATQVADELGSEREKANVMCLEVPRFETSDSAEENPGVKEDFSTGKSSRNRDFSGNPIDRW
jgi:hypothetical protein